MPFHRESSRLADLKLTHLEDSNNIVPRTMEVRELDDEVDDWLSNIGKSEYARAFVEMNLNDMLNLRLFAARKFLCTSLCLHLLMTFTTVVTSLELRVSGLLTLALSLEPNFAALHEFIQELKVLIKYF